METEMLLRVIAVVIAGAILLSNFDFTSVLSYVKSFFQRKIKPVDTEIKTVSFLDIVNSWHVLKNQCEEYGLEEAVAKIDEVFPLLNTED